MRVRLLPSGHERPGEDQYLTSFVIDDRIAVDAGALGITGGTGSIEHVFLTHSHADHVFSLPLFLEHAAATGSRPVLVHGGEETLRAVRECMFNDRIWPDLVRLAPEEGEIVRLHPSSPESPVEAAGFRVTAVPVDHSIPTFGYLVEDAGGVIAFGADSGPTTRLWELARAEKKLRAVFLEATFPNAMQAHARRTGHLTPADVAGEIRKIGREVRVYVAHIRPRHRPRILEELEDLSIPDLVVARPGVDLPC